MSDIIRSVHLALARADVEPVRVRLAGALPPGTMITEDDRPLAMGSVLLIAPHELDAGRRAQLLGRGPWSWVHLTTAGYDFFPMAQSPPSAWITRSWRAYAAPLAEYVVRALIEQSRRADGTGLRGRRVGVVGYGETGRRIVDILRLLEAKPVVLTRTPRPLPLDGVDVARRLDDLLGMQALVLAAPLNASSTQMLDHAFLDACAPGLHVVNVSRGEMIDQDALLEAVRERGLWATLDVTVPEPLPAQHPLRREERVVITEHVAWHTGTNDYAYLDDFFDVWSALRERREPPGLLRGPHSEPAITAGAAPNVRTDAF